MAKRGFDTSFWTGKYVRGLPPYEKLTYCYLINYPMGSLIGIFDEDVAQFSFDLGIPEEALAPIIDRLIADGKAARVGDRLALTKWNKHQATNPSIVAGVKRQLLTLCTQDLLTLQQSGYSLPPYMRWESLIKEVERRESDSGKEQPATGSPQTGTPNHTTPHYTTLRPKGLGGGGTAGMAPAAPVHPAGWSLTEEELAALDAEFPDIDIDGEYDKARHSSSIRHEQVSNPEAFMRARFQAISTSEIQAR